VRRLRAIWLVALTTALVLLLAFQFALQQQTNRGLPSAAPQSASD